MRRTKEDAEITRKKLLDTALNMFGEQGYEATRLADIAKEAGVTRGAIYWHFKNKDDLILQVIKEHADVFFQLIESELALATKSKTKLVEIFKKTSIKIIEDKKFFSLVMLANYYYRNNDTYRQLQEFHNSRDKYYYELVEGLIAIAQKENEITKKHSAQDITVFISCLITGIIGLVQNHKTVVTPEEINIDALAMILEAAILP